MTVRRTPFCKNQDIESDISKDSAIYSWHRRYAGAVPSSINDFEIGSTLFIHRSFPVGACEPRSLHHMALRQCLAKPGTPSALRQATFGVPTMNVKSLIQEELGEGMTEQELASSIGVSLQTLENILADKFPEDPANWETFARYFRMDVDKLRTGGSTHSITILNLSESTDHSAAGDIRR